MSNNLQEKVRGLFFLSISAALILFWQYPYLKEICFDHDLAGYIYSVMDVLQGNSWYHASCLPRPPGIHFIILLAFKLFGQSFKSIYLAALFFNVISVSLVYLLAKRVLSKVTKLYYLLPVIFTLLFISESFKAYTANTEVFALTFEAGGMLFLGMGQYFLSGLFFGLGFMIRQLVVLNLLVGLLFIICVQLIDKKSFKKMLKNIVVFSSAFILPFVLVSLYFLSLGVFDKFLNYTFLYNLRDASNYFGFIRSRDLPYANNVIWSSLRFEIIFFGFFAFCGTLRAFLFRNKIMLLASFWFIITALGLLVTAVYQHHFIQLIAPLACISLLGFSDILDIVKTVLSGKVYFKRILIVILFGFLAVACAHLTWIIFYERMNSYKYINVPNDRLEAAIYIKERTAPEDKIFVWDELSTGSIILWSGRANMGKFHEKYAYLPPQLRVYWNPYVGDYRFNQKEFISELKLHKPKYIIFVWEHYGAIGFNDLVKNQDISDLGWSITRQVVELERVAFFEFFEILSNEYRLEKKINSCRIYRRI